MHTIERKIHLIEEVLKADNDGILDVLENAFIKSKNQKDNKLKINDFIGVISIGESEQLKEVIRETADWQKV